MLLGWRVVAVSQIFVDGFCERGLYRPTTYPVRLSLPIVVADKTVGPQQRRAMQPGIRRDMRLECTKAGLKAGHGVVEKLPLLVL